MRKNEEEFILRNKGFIVATVRNFASRGGYAEENEVNIEDMIQEATLSVIETYRRKGAGEDGIFPFAGVIQNACKSVIASYLPIRVPQYWLSKKKGDVLRFRCESTDELIEVNHDGEFASSDIEDTVLSKIVVEDLIGKATGQGKLLFELILSGLNIDTINKQYGISRSSAYYHLERAKQYIEGDNI